MRQIHRTHDNNDEKNILLNAQLNKKFDNVHEKINDDIAKFLNFVKRITDVKKKSIWLQQFQMLQINIDLNCHNIAKNDTLNKKIINNNDDDDDDKDDKDDDHDDDDIEIGGTDDDADDNDDKNDSDTESCKFVNIHNIKRERDNIFQSFQEESDENILKRQHEFQMNILNHQYIQIREEITKHERSEFMDLCVMKRNIKRCLTSDSDNDFDDEVKETLNAKYMKTFKCIIEDFENDNAVKMMPNIFTFITETYV